MCKSYILDIFWRKSHDRPQHTVCFVEIMMFARRCLGLALFWNELVTSELTRKKLGWTVYMIPISITLPNQVIKATSWLWIQGLPTQIFKASLIPSRHGIERGFFSRVQNHINLHLEPEFAKFISCWFLEKSLMIGHNAPYFSLKTCYSYKDV